MINTFGKSNIASQYEVLKTITQSSNYNFSIHGIIPPGYNRKAVYLQISDSYSSQSYKQLDSTVVNDSIFTFNGLIHKECELASLWIKDKNGHIEFYTQFLIDTGSNTFKIKKVESDYYRNKLYNINIPSSKTNALLLKEDSLNNKYYSLFAIQDPQDNRVRNLPAERLKELNLLMINEIVKNRDNYYSLIYLRTQLGRARNTVKEEELLFNTFAVLNPRLKDCQLGLELYSLLDERLKNIGTTRIGEKAPIFSIKTFESKVFNNENLVGQPYIIVFSATWCMPCQKQLPKFISLYAKYKNRGLKVIYFNLDDDTQKWAEHIKKNKLSWINVSERTKFRDSKISTQFHVYAIPSCFVVDKLGTIIYNSDQIDQDLNHLESYILKGLE